MRHSETEEMILRLEIEHHEDVRHQDRNKGGERRPGDPESRQPHQAKDEQGSEDHIQSHAQDLKADRRLDDPGCARAPKPIARKRELQEHARDKPEHVAPRERRGGAIGAELVAINPRNAKATTASPAATKKSDMTND